MRWKLAIPVAAVIGGACSSPSIYEKVRYGMTPEELQSSAGKPLERKIDRPGEESWTYGGFLEGDCVVRITTGRVLMRPYCPKEDQTLLSLPLAERKNQQYRPPVFQVPKEKQLRKRRGQPEELKKRAPFAESKALSIAAQLGALEAGDQRVPGAGKPSAAELEEIQREAARAAAELRSPASVPGAASPASLSSPGATTAPSVPAPASAPAAAAANATAPPAAPVPPSAPPPTAPLPR